MSVLLNVSYYKIYEYIWFKGGDMNGFRDIKAFMKWRGWGLDGHATGRLPRQCY